MAGVATSGALLGNSLTVDTKHFAKPKKRRGKDSEYQGWRFQLINYLMIINLNFVALMGGNERRATEYATSATDPGEPKAHSLFCAVISSCTAGRAIPIVMDTPGRDGKEAMRRLDAEFRLAMRSRQMALPNMIMKPELGKKSTWTV